MPALRKYDFEALYKEHDQDHPNLTRQEFAALKGIGYTYLSREFHKIDEREEERYRRNAKRILLQAAPDAARGLRETANNNNTPINFRTTAQTAILDRIGISPQSANLQATQVNIQVNIPPLFADSSNAQDMKALLTGEVIDQKAADEA